MKVLGTEITVRFSQVHWNSIYLFPESAVLQLIHSLLYSTCQLSDVNVRFRCAMDLGEPLTWALCRGISLPSPGLDLFQRSYGVKPLRHPSGQFGMQISAMLTVVRTEISDQIRLPLLYVCVDTIGMYVCIRYITRFLLSDGYLLGYSLRFCWVS